jgi:curli biogenesis system outer membrane secretion channel CsgG
VFRRTLLLTTMALAALALAVTPAFAGEEPDPTAAPPAQPSPSPSPTPAPTAPVVHGSAKLRTSQGCLTNNEAKASVSGKSIASVAFYVDGRKVKTVSSPDASGRYTFTMNCSHLSIGTHRARAAVSFESGATPTQRTMLFQITRARAAIPQFAG